MSQYKKSPRTKKLARPDKGGNAREDMAGSSERHELETIPSESSPESSHSNPQVNLDNTEKSSISNSEEEYIPRPYTFRVPLSASPGEINRGLAKSPPFYLLFDHTLAVIWILFSQNEVEKPLGIAQLHWALHFLEGVYNEDGEHPADVSLCIDAIQDKLIQQYADISETVKPKDEQCTTPGCKCPRKPPSAEFLMLQTLPFSVNYDEMNRNCPGKVEQLFKASQHPSTDTEMQKQFDSYKQGTVNDSFLNETYLRNDAMVDFLRSWRKEQMDKIQMEVERLRSIDTWMGKVDKEYIEATQLPSDKSQNDRKTRFAK